jgi:hypothetical protein
MMSASAPSPAPQAFYPTGTAASTFGTFAVGAAAAGVAAAAAGRRNQDAVEEMEDPFADPVWNVNDSPVRSGGTSQPLLGGWAGSPQRPGTRGSGMSRFREDVV